MKQSELDLLFGIGFRIGFLVVLVGLLTLCVEMADILVVAPIFNLIGFGETVNSMPGWLQATTAVGMLVGATFVINEIKGYLEAAVEDLLGEE